MNIPKFNFLLNCIFFKLLYHIVLIPCNNMSNSVNFTWITSDLRMCGYCSEYVESKDIFFHKCPKQAHKVKKTLPLYDQPCKIIKPKRRLFSRRQK